MFNIYRSSDGSPFVRIAQVAYQSGTHIEYFDATAIGYQVKAQFKLNSGICESDPAHPLNNPTGNSVMVTMTSSGESIEENVKFYPNPTTSVLNIEAKDLCHIAVFNTIGQCLIEHDTSGNTTNIDLSHFENGMYVIRLTLQNSILVKQVHLMR